MSYIFLMSFLVSLLISQVVIFSASSGESGIMDHDLDAIQKMHDKPVPRIGGAAIFVSLVFIVVYGASIQASWSQFYAGMIASVFFVFIGGFAEDISKKVSPSIRIVFIVAAVVFSVFVVHSMDLIRNLESETINLAISYDVVAFIITCFAVVGISNAYNMIDGYNGLSSASAMINVLGIAYLSYALGDSNILFCSLVLVSTIFGFFVCNYPYGKIFLGDGGSYLIGFLISLLSINLIEAHSGDISPFAVLLLVVYPFTEAIFTILRRKLVHKTKATQPDDLHLHQLVFSKCTDGSISLMKRNARVMPIILIMVIPQTLAVIFFYKSTPIMLLGILLYVLYYVCVYLTLMFFKKLSV